MKSHHTPSPKTTVKIAIPQPHPTLLLLPNHEIVPKTLDHPLVPHFAAVSLAPHADVEGGVVGEVKRCLFFCQYQIFQSENERGGDDDAHVNESFTLRGK